MKPLPRRSFVCLGAILLTLPCHVQTAFAGLGIIVPACHKRHYKHAPPWVAPSKGPAAESNSLPAEEPPTINPGAAPSLSLQPFLDTHLDKILAPMGTPAFAQSDLIAYVREDYAQALPTATEARKPAYQLAVAVCDAMINSVAERQKAVAALNGAYERRSSESIQPRGGKRAVQESDKDEAFFYDSQKNNWLQNAAALRQQVAALYQREHAAETQAGGPWVPPPAAPAPETAGAAPSVSVPAPATAKGQNSGDDPVVGQWKLNGYIDTAVKPDHTFSNKHHGTWQLVDATDGKRHYEFHYDKHKNWVDSLVLSEDGRSLEGADKHGTYVSAQRE